MISPNIQPVPMVIERERKKGNKARGELLPNALDVVDVLNDRVMDNLGDIVEVEGVVEDIGVNRDSQDTQGDGGKGFVHPLWL